MYIPEKLKGKDLSILDELMAFDAFGTLISIVNAVPFASHLPVIMQRRGNEVLLQGHWSRGNPQWKDIERQRVLLICHGPHAYISPQSYTDPRDHVPTWNYVVAHVYGRIRTMHDPNELESMLTTLTETYETGENAWQLTTASARSQAKINGIVGFELRADDIQIMLKLSQNHSKENILGTIAKLRQSQTQHALALADMMERTMKQATACV